MSSPLRLPLRLPLALPTLTALIGSGGFIIGIYSFVSPVSAARIYGVELPPAPTATEKPDDNPHLWSPDHSPQPQSPHLAYIYAHGIRNFVTGLSILSLTAYRLFAPECQSRAAGLVAQRCLGIVVTVGALTPVVDAGITWRAARIGDDGAGDGARKAARAHAARSLVWLAGGLWCLLGG